MIYICTQPKTPYYAWQLEVMLTNFKEVGILGSHTHVLLSVDRNIDHLTNISSTKLQYEKIIEKFPDVHFFEYTDTRVIIEPLYIKTNEEHKLISPYLPSIISNTVKQHYKKFSYLKNKAIFLHDCDMIFTRTPDFVNLEGDDTCYVSDSRGFIYSDYILPKGIDLYEDMCDIVGIDYDIPIKYNDDSGGSQYIFKNVDYKFWHKVEMDSDKLFEYFQVSEPKRVENDNSYYGIQQFTAGMWAMLWNCWYFDLPVKISTELAFSWATDPIEKWDSCGIFHNSGVTEKIADDNNIFCKSRYMEGTPYKDVLENEYNNKFSSYNYVELIRKVAKNSCF